MVNEAGKYRVSLAPWRPTLENTQGNSQIDMKGASTMIVMKNGSVLAPASMLPGGAQMPFICAVCCGGAAKSVGCMKGYLCLFFPVSLT